MYILLKHRVKVLNVWSGMLEDPQLPGESSQKSVKTVFVVGGPRLREATLAQADDGFACEDVLDDWTLEQELDGGKAAAGRTEVAFCEEYDIIQREKAELIKRMRELTLKESTFDGQAAVVPELYAELASRRRAEWVTKPSTLEGLETSPTKDPVASLWQNMEDTHSPPRGRKQRQERRSSSSEGPQHSQSIGSPSSGRPSAGRRCECSLATKTVHAQTARTELQADL